MSMSASELPAAAFHPPAPGPAATSVRAQLLATEHWSLLATRSMTWSEVMSRITIHLTVTSASLVVLALMAQAQGFGGAFQTMSIGLCAVVLVLGTLTAQRVVNASVDDASAVLGMNRLRAAYLEIDPGLEPYLITSWHDDQRGLMGTYLMGWPRSTFSHVLASTSVFMLALNSMVAGTLAALIAHAAGAGTAVVAVAGAVVGLGHVAAMLALGNRTFRTPKQQPRFPSPPAGPRG
jgi:uncharacterized membrane protein YuzA (DUF378 family)